MPFQDGLRSGLEAAAGITGKAVPWAGAASPPSPVGNASPSPSPPSPSTLVVGRPRTIGEPSRASSATARGLVLPQPRVSVGRKAWGRRVAGWGFSAVEAFAVRAIIVFLRKTVAKVKAGWLELGVWGRLGGGGGGPVAATARVETVF